MLTRDLIDDQGVLSFSELLNNVAGSSNSLGRSTPFGTATTQIRGQDVLLYRDGLRDVDYSDIDNSALNNVERVEVLKGAAGLISGTGGAGGIINIITKRPTDFAQISLAGPGTHLIALESYQQPISLKAEKFNAYIKEDGLTQAIDYRTQNKATGTPGREIYSRRAKVLLQVGDAPSDQVLRPIGQTLEIVPLRNPYKAPPPQCPCGSCIRASRSRERWLH